MSEHDKALLGYLQTTTAFRQSDERADMRKAGSGYAYSCLEQYVLENGRFFTPQELPRRYARRTIKLCFANANRLARQSTRLRYVEGYASSIIPVHHAWCVDPDDRVVDPTWPTPGRAYMGIVFDAFDLDVGESMIDNWKDHWPLLRRSDG